MSGAPGVVYIPRPDATPEAELNALANVYRFVLGKAHRHAPGVSDTGVTTLKNTEEVGDVERRPR